MFDVVDKEDCVSDGEGHDRDSNEHGEGNETSDEYVNEEELWKMDSKMETPIARLYCNLYQELKKMDSKMMFHYPF